MCVARRRLSQIDALIFGAPYTNTPANKCSPGHTKPLTVCQTLASGRLVTPRPSSLKSWATVWLKSVVACRSPIPALATGRARRQAKRSSKSHCRRRGSERRPRRRSRPPSQRRRRRRCRASLLTPLPRYAIRMRPVQGVFEAVAAVDEWTYRERWGA